MGRSTQKQVRIGKKELPLLRSLIYRVRRYAPPKHQKRKPETWFNNQLFKFIRQKNKFGALKNRKIGYVTFFGRKFNPDCSLPNNNTEKFIAVECKRLTDKGAKRLWKEGLSQCLLYATTYKAVLFVLYDFTKKTNYSRKLNRGNKTETRFTASLREQMNVHIITLKPQ